MPKFTKRFVESIVPDTQKMTKYWDSELKGFGLIILPSGRRTYCVQYRNAQRVQKMFKIGTHGQITTEEARVLAKKYLSGVVHGHDPVQVKKDPMAIKCPYGLSFVEVFSFLTEKLALGKFQVSQQPLIGFDLYSIANRQLIFPVLLILL